MNNRQAGRRRGRGGQRQGGNPGRPDNGNRIDNRARGNAAQLLEKYKNLARDSQMSGDRVNTEYYLQFADHYFRVLSESRSRFEEQNQHRRQRDDDVEDGDDEFGFEGEPISAVQQSRQNEFRDDGDPREGGGHRDRGDGGRHDRGRERLSARDARPVPANDAADDEGQRPASDEQPRRRGRPRRDAAVPSEANGFDVDRLPPSLGSEAANAEAPAEERPRRGRPRRTRTDDEAAPPAA